MTIPVSIVRLFIFGVLLTAAALAVDNDALAHHTQTDTSNLFRVWCDEHYALVNIRSVPNAYSGGNRQRACRIPNRNRGQDFENCLRFPLPSGYGTPYLEGTANILPPDTPVCEVVIPDNVRGDELRDGYDASNRAQTNRPGGTLQAENIPGGIRVFGWTPPFSGNWPEYQLHRMDDQGVVIVFSHVADASSAGEAFDYGETLPLVAGVQYQFKIRPVASDGITFGDFSLPTPAQLEYAAIPARVVTVFISDSTNGTVSAEWSGDANLQNEGTVPAETNVTFTARPDDDFYVSGWSGDCESAGDTGDFAAPGAPQTCVRTAAMNVTVGAVFTQGLVCEGGLVAQDGECVVDSAGLYEHYFPAADRLSKCQALDGDQVVVDVRDPNAADPAANVAYFCNTRNVGDVCYLRKDGDYAAGIEGLRTHPGGFNFLDPVTHPPPPVCTDYAPPCYDEDDDLDHFQNPFTANCAGPPGSGPRATVFISTSANGTVSAESSGGLEVQNEGTVPVGTTVTFTAEPESGYGFSAWTGACQGEANPCALAAAAAVTVGAEFVHTGEYTGACALTNFSESARAGLSLRIDACVAKGWEVGEEFGLFCYCGIKVRNESSGALSCGVPRTNSRLPGVAANGNVYLAAYFGDSLEHLPQKTEANMDACFVAGCPGGKEPSGLNMHGETECRSPVNCGAENREQLSGTYVCGECLTGFEESGGACVQGAGCAGEGKQDGANPGECGGCLASHTADGDGNCHLRVDCAGLNKIQTNEYTCGDCLADFTEDDSELCRANADCAAAFKVQTNPYTCGACLPDHTQSGDDCIPDVDCAALFRVQATPGQCGNCLANYIPAPSGLACRPVAPPPPPDSVSVFISTSTNGTVSAGWDGDANLQNEGTVPFGATVTFTATPAAGHAFSSWTGDCQGAANPCALEAAAAVTVGAVFAENCTKTLIDAAGGDLAQVECNLRAGADVNATGGNNNRSPLHWAVIGQQVEIIRLLLAAAGIDPNVRDGTYGSNPLIEAAFHGRAEIAGILANHHLVDLNIASNSGNRALHDAAGRGHLAVVNTLLAAGAEVNPQNNASRTPLGEAQNGGHGAIAARLIAAGGHYGTACHLLGGTVNPTASSPPCLGLPPLNLSAGALYEHYFPSSGRGAKCEGYSASAVGSALFANSSGTGAGAGYACRDAGSSICYLSHNNTPPNSLWRAGGHALNPATPECPAFRPPCLGASGQPDNARNPFAEACLGAVLPPLVSVVFAESPNGTVSAQWKFDPDLRGGEALPAGTTVTFTAEPEPDHEFSAWTDACEGEANPCVVPVTANATVGAEFTRTAAASVAVNYSKLPGGHAGNGGTLAEADGRASGFQVAAGATVTFTAAPNPGWTVTWNDESGCDGGVTVCEVIAVADVNLTAIFGTGDDALLEKYFPGGGNQHCATVGGNTDPLTHPGGSDVIGRECFGVSVGETACVQLGESFDPSRDIWNSNGDILNDYSSGIPPLCSQEYPPCDGAQVKPDGNPFAACVDPPPPPRQVSYSKLPGGHASNGGAVTVIGQQRDAPFEVAADATVTFTAAPNPGWTVTWNDESGCDDEERTCEVIASGDLKVTAIFDAGNDALLEEYFPAADPHQHCQILGGHISYTVVDSGSAPFTVVGRLCARQFGFSVDCMQLGNAHDPVRRARDGDEIDLLDPYPPLCSEEYPPCDGPGETKPGENPFAACVAPPAVVSVFITPSPGGIVSARWGGNPDLQNEETVPFGTQVTFAAEPDPGRAFAAWTGDCQGRPNPCVREATADLTVGATFPLLVTISRDRPDNAELSAVLPPDADPLPTLLVTFADLPVRFTADPAPGHFIAEWQGVPPGQSCPPPGDVGQAQTCEITPAANLHIAVVARLARRLFYSHSPGGTVRAEDSQGRTVPDRGEIRDRFRLVATPDPGFFIALWRADGADGAETCPAGIAADSAQTCPLQAQSRNAHAYVKFQPARRVSVAAAENGAVAARDHPDPAQGRDLSGGGLIPDGATLHLTATPDDGHFIFEWLGAPEDNACPKGQAVTVATECAFPVRRDLEAGAVFAALPESVMRIEISEAYLRENCKGENLKPKGASSHAAVGDLKNSANETIGAICSAVPNLFDLASTYRCYALSPDSIGTPPSEFESDAQALKSCGEELFCANRGVQALDGNYFNQLPENCPLAAHRVTIVQTGDGGLRLYREDGETEILAGTDLESGTSVVFAASPAGQHYISEWHGLDGCPVGFSTQFQLIPGGGYRVDCPVRISGPLEVSVSFAPTPAAVSVLYSHSSGGTLRASVSAGSLSSGGTVGLLATVDFSAVADSGFYVSGWVGAEVSHCASGVGATLVLCRAEAVRHPLEVRADFAAEAVFHRVDFSASSGGTLRVLDLLARRVVSGSQPGVLSGSLLRLDADADSGFHLFGWGGWPGASSCARGVFTVSEVCEVRAESPLAVRAEFRRFHRADFSAGGVGGTGGTVSAVDFRGESVSPGGRVSGGTTVTFTAVPAAEHQVGAWVGIGASACGSGPAAILATECPVRVDGDLEVRAVFSPRARSSVSYSHSGGGTVSAADAAGRSLPPRGGSVLQGATVTFTATPDAAAGRYVSSWSGIGGASCASGFSATLATRCAVAADSHLAVSVLFGILPGPGLLAEIQKPAGTGDASAALRHLQAGADPDLRGGAENLPAVILAGVNGHAEIVSVLVTFGADADAAGANDWTLPFYLAMNGVDNSGASPTIPWATALEVLEHFDSALSLAAGTGGTGGTAAEFDWAGVDSSNGHPALAHLDYRHANWITNPAERVEAEAVGDFLYWRSRSADVASGTAPTDAESQCGSYANTEERRTSRICRGPATAPHAAQNFSAMLVSLETRTTISLRWDAPDYNQWSVTGYTIYRVEASPSSGTTDCAGLTYPNFSAGSTFTYGADATLALNDVGSAGYGKCFKYEIAAENVAGGGATTESDGVYVQGLPDAPFGVSATMIAAAGGFGSAISISWSPPATLRGAVIRAYEILREEEVGGETSLVLIGETAGTTFIDSSFPRGAMIRYAVRARSSAGGFRPPDGGGSPPVSDPVSDSSPPLETPQAARDADADEAVSPENRERTLRAVAGYFGFGHAIPVGNGYGLEQETFAGFDYDRAAEVISIRADNPVRADADLVLAVTALAVCADCNPAELTVTIRFSPVLAPPQASLIAAYDSNFAHAVSLPSGFESGGTLAIASDASGGFDLNGSGMLVRDSALTLTPGVYEISLEYSHADFLGTLALEVRADVGPDCASEKRLAASANPLACGECDSGYGDLNGHCVPADGNVEDDAEMCGTIFLGDYEAVLDDEGAVIGGVCSGIDINDTFCFLGVADALPCQGLFIHVRDCNLKHNRPALDPWHCGKACADGKSAVGARCVESE